MSKHTPGPWRVGLHGGKVGSMSTVVSDHSVPEVGGSDAVEYYGGHMIAESIAPRNGRLIAAAPELLEALKGFMAACGHAEKCDARDFQHELTKGHSAIAKAEGEE